MTIASTPDLRSVVARDAMHGPVIAVDPFATFGEVATVMRTERVHCVVVEGVSSDQNGEHLVWGVVSDLDLIRAATADVTPPSAGELARSKAICVGVDEDLHAVSTTLVEHGCSHVVVVENERPVGVISTLDIACVLGA